MKRRLADVRGSGQVVAAFRAAGDRVTVTVASGPIRYVVSRVRTYSKGSLADHAGRLFSQEVRGRLVLVATTSLISVNWLVYIWAVHAGRVLEASLGYFVNPLVNVLLGVVFLREPLSRPQKISVAIATLGVAVLVLSAGRFPWVALVLALSFGTYGLLRKKERIDAVGGLFLETGLVAPLAALWLLHLARSGAGHFGEGPRLTLLLAAAGVITAVPLIWFALGVQRLRLSTIGLLQYLAPSMQFSIAVFLFHEPFTASHGVAFACIWGSLALYTWDTLRALRRAEA